MNRSTEERRGYAARGSVDAVGESCRFPSHDGAAVAGMMAGLLPQDIGPFPVYPLSLDRFDPSLFYIVEELGRLRMLCYSRCSVSSTGDVFLGLWHRDFGALGASPGSTAMGFVRCFRRRS